MRYNKGGGKGMGAHCSAATLKEAALLPELY